MNFVCDRGKGLKASMANPYPTWCPSALPAVFRKLLSLVLAVAVYILLWQRSCIHLIGSFQKLYSIEGTSVIRLQIMTVKILENHVIVRGLYFLSDNVFLNQVYSSCRGGVF